MAYHTFEFLRRRRKDPKWRDAYLNAVLRRLLVAIFILLIAVGAVYISNNNIDIITYLEIIFEKATNFVNNIFN